MTYLEGAFVFLVTGAAIVWAPLALLTGGAFLIALAVVNDRRAPSEPA